MIDSFAPYDPSLLDFVLPEHDGYPAHLAAEDTPDALRCAAGEASRKFPESWWIEPKYWAEYARDNDLNNTSGLNYVDRFTNQPPTHECTTHSLVTIMGACWNLQRGIIYPDGPKKDYRYEESSIGSVWFSALSVYAEANPGQWGGANVRQVMEIACRRGVLPDKIQPHEYNFKHTLHGTAGKGNSNQSSGPFLKVNRFPDGWQETSKHFKPEEVVFPEMWEQAVCATLRRRLVGVGRDGHAIPWAQPMFKGNNLDAMAYPDSYNVIRYDSLATIKRAYRGAFFIVSMTTPDDFLRPAG